MHLRVAANSEEQSDNQHQIGLKRSLGPLDGAALIFANVVGVGIFTTPGIVFQHVPDYRLFLFIWAIGGFYSIVGAFAYGRLATSFPEAGGEYVYLKKAYGPLTGFLSGWTSFVAGFSGAIAASAVGCASYLQAIGPFHHLDHKWIAIALILIFSALHAFSVKFGSKINVVLVIGILVVLLVFGFKSLAGSHSFGTVSKESQLLMAFIPVAFTFSGWNAVTYIAEEVRNPAKNIMRASLVGTSVVILVYMLINNLYIRVIPPEDFSGSIKVGNQLAVALFPETGAMLITLLIVLALISSISAMIMAAPRIYFAMARDTLLPQRLIAGNDGRSIPANTIWVQAAWTMLLVISGTFEEILIYTGFSIMVFSGLAVSTYFKLIPFKGSATELTLRFTFVLFMLISLLVVANAIFNQPRPALWGTGIILLGIPFYYFFRKAAN